MDDGITRVDISSLFVAKHLSNFSSTVMVASDPDDTSGKKGKAFAQGLPEVASEHLPEGLIRRSQVLRLVADTNVNTMTVSASIMAWGGMRMDHRNMAFLSPHTNSWLNVANAIRSGTLTRCEAYDAFSELRETKRLKGMGPAYFTKLIYFLMPRGKSNYPPGFIMDQWAGCSINVLTGKPTVLMDSVGHWTGEGDTLRKAFTFIVSDCNTGDHYETFCASIDALAEHYEQSGDQIDRALLSKGGRHPAKWRQYIKDNRCP